MGNAEARVVRIEQGIHMALRRLGAAEQGAASNRQQLREAWNTLPNGGGTGGGTTTVFFACSPCTIPEVTLTATFNVPGVGTTTTNLTYCPNGLVNDNTGTNPIGRPLWVGSCFRISGATGFSDGWYYVVFGCYASRGGTTGSSTTYRAMLLFYGDVAFGSSAAAQARCNSDNAAVRSPGVGGFTSGGEAIVWDHYTTAPACSPFFVTLWDNGAGTKSVDISQ